MPQNAHTHNTFICKNTYLINPSITRRIWLIYVTAGLSWDYILEVIIYYYKTLKIANNKVLKYTAIFLNKNEGKTLDKKTYLWCRIS